MCQQVHLVTTFMDLSLLVPLSTPLPLCCVWETDHTVLYNISHMHCFFFSLRECGHMTWAFHFLSPHSSVRNHHHWNQYHLLIFCHLCVRYPTNWHHLQFSHQPCKAGLITSTLQMTKLRLWEVKMLAHESEELLFEFWSLCPRARILTTMRNCL